MKRYYFVLFTFFICVLVLYAYKVEAILPLSGKVIVVDAGHGKEDPGTSVGNLYEKDLNLNISLYLEKELSKKGAIVILTRDGDYDLSTPNATYRKKSDFDNRIKLINNSKANMYLSIHINFYSDLNYKGPQIFYTKENKKIASTIQEVMNTLLNGNREIKTMPDIYMYKRLKVPGVLIECGFLSNYEERNLLKTKEYQEKLAKSITDGVIEYFSN